MNLPLLSKANAALRAQDFASAIACYAGLLVDDHPLREIIVTNLALAREKYRHERNAAVKWRVALCGWNDPRQPSARTHALAKGYTDFAEADIISPPGHFAGNETVFPQKALLFVAVHPYDRVHLVQPHWPNLYMGILYKQVWDATVLVDLDDEELSINCTAELPVPGAWDGQDCTRLGLGLANAFDGITVSSPALQQRYGGTLIDNTSDDSPLRQMTAHCENQPLSSRAEQFARALGIDLLDAVLCISKARLDQVRHVSKRMPAPSKKLAVAVHVYYLELWPEIAARLKNITHPFDLYITTPPDQAMPVMSAIRSDFPQANIQVKPNRGMDILPFLEWIPRLIDEGYLAVCKLHTKKGHGDYGPLWRQVLLDSLIGDRATFAACAAAFARHPELQMVGPASLYLSARQHMLGNALTLEALFQHLENRPLPTRDWGFFSGTMFWIRPGLLAQLASHILQNIGQFETTYQKDGQLVHAIERLFGLLPVIHRGQVGLLHPNRPSHSPAYTLQMTSPMTHISQAGLDDLMQQYANLVEDHTRLEQDNRFDSNHYRQQSPFLTGSAIDLVTHYLVLGRFQGKLFRLESAN